MNETYKIDYETFDSQIVVLCNMVEAFAVGWSEYSATELSMDIKSMCMKASRLCFLADLDTTAQQQDITLERREMNVIHRNNLNHTLFNIFTPLICHIVEDMHDGGSLDGVKQPRFEGHFAEMLPHLGPLLADSDSSSHFDELTKTVESIQNEITKLQKTSSHGEKPVMRLWHLCELYAYLCYLYYHFDHLVKGDKDELPLDELKRLFVVAIHNYADSDEGKTALDTFRTRLIFKNNGAPLSKEILQEAGKALVNELPESVQLPYMNHRNDLNAMVEEMVRLKPSASDILALATVVAKWQMLSIMIYELDNPKRVSNIENTIFRTELHGKPINMNNLRERIGRMAQLVERKNHWFCLWCVLKHHNLLADLHFEAFATQMMHPAWFGTSHLPSFKGDNLTDYRDYFSNTDYTLWNFDDFHHYRTLHSKSTKKWSDSLFNTFHHLCYEMDEEFG